MVRLSIQKRFDGPGFARRQVLGVEADFSSPAGLQRSGPPTWLCGADGPELMLKSLTSAKWNRFLSRKRNASRNETVFVGRTLQILAEVRMRKPDDCLGAFRNGPPFQVGHAKFGNQIHHV